MHVTSLGVQRIVLGTAVVLFHTICFIKIHICVCSLYSWYSQPEGNVCSFNHYYLIVDCILNIACIFDVDLQYWGELCRSVKMLVELIQIQLCPS